MVVQLCTPFTPKCFSYHVVKKIGVNQWVHSSAENDIWNTSSLRKKKRDGGRRKGLTTFIRAEGEEGARAGQSRGSGRKYEKC